MEEFEIFKKRAREFVLNAKNSAKRKRYDIAIFNLEQSAQLLIKYLLGKKLGDFPKTHSLVLLLEELGKAYNAEKMTKLFINKNFFDFEFLESSYINSRYLAYYYNKEHWSKLLKFYNTLKDFLQKITNENLS